MSKNRLLLIGIAGVVVAGVVWYSFMRDDDAALLVTEDLTQATESDRDIVNVLLQLRAVTLSGTIFTDPTFMTLQDFGSEIVPEPVGRPNPFAPLGLNTQASTSTAAGTTTTPR